ncbi:GntR family transcriptional regulator [Allopusillimonas ginsengisoli]|uniref:GntR family transcriptional regulator n=1 Tax=Allopusillimonas ginsengisoli TaxID=453575 RepID=UPI001020687B|nr:GntR family transcriptional regulator [Allopusillimonas ginsengisoli]TEA80013.1 GntR family transcriptional regulator [Allopusillimonas ginsengisoli]
MALKTRTAHLAGDEQDEPRTKRSLSDEVYESLITQLVSLEIPPGSRLTVDTLARTFGVSQTPVRAALIRLQTEGLIVGKHNAGFWVAPIPTEKYFSETYLMRELLEPEAAALAADNARADDVRQLRELCSQMEQLVLEGTKKNYGRFAILDDAFHSTIITLSDNGIMKHVLENLHAHMHLFRLRYHASVAEEAIEEHKKIVDGIQNRDSSAARAAMSAHIISSRNRMIPFYHASTTNPPAMPGATRESAQ